MEDFSEKNRDPQATTVESDVQSPLRMPCSPVIPVGKACRNGLYENTIHPAQSTVYSRKDKYFSYLDRRLKLIQISSLCLAHQGFCVL